MVSEHPTGPLIGKNYLWAMLSGDELELQFCSETEGFCVEDFFFFFFKESRAREEESEDPITRVVASLLSLINHVIT